MRLWISGGGTAGHVYPALTVLDACLKDSEAMTVGPVEALWLGTAEGMEARLVPSAGVPFRALAAGPVVDAGWRLPFSLGRLMVGLLQAWRLAGQRRPDVVLVTGGFVSVPAAVAARLRRIPLAVFLPDVRPGRAVSLVARFASRVMTTSSAALPHLPRTRSEATGYPVRGAIRAASRDAARVRLGVPEGRPLLLVFGGSRGARQINLATVAAAEELLPRCEVLHITGPLDFETVRAHRATLPTDAAKAYRVVQYLAADAMADALAAADLVVSRAGAAVLGEYPARALPSILVPLPISGGHQYTNAAVLADAGAARIVEDEALTWERLATEVVDLLDDPDEMASMSRAAATLDRPEAASRICAVLREIAGTTPR